jgi:hypothetical protein
MRVREQTIKMEFTVKGDVTPDEAIGLVKQYMTSNTRKPHESIEVTRGWGDDKQVATADVDLGIIETYMTEYEEEDPTPEPMDGDQS